MNGAVLRVVEHEHLAGVRVGLLVRGDAPVAGELPVPRLAARAARACSGSKRVEIAALVERRERAAGVHDHVGARRVLHPRARAPTVVRAPTASGPPRMPAPQRCARGLLGLEAGGADEAVAVLGRCRRRNGSCAACRRRRTGGTAGRSTGAPGSRCCAGRRRQRSSGISPIDVEIGRVVLDEVRLPRAGAVRVVVVEPASVDDTRPDDLDVHDPSSPIGGPRSLGADATTAPAPRRSGARRREGGQPAGAPDARWKPRQGRFPTRGRALRRVPRPERRRHRARRRRRANRRLDRRRRQPDDLRHAVQSAGRNACACDPSAFMTNSSEQQPSE